VVTLGTIVAIGPLSIDMYLPALPAIAGAFSTSPSEVQLTLAACLAGLAAGQLVTGPLSDRFGRRRPLVAGLGAYVAASLLCALAPTVQVLIGLRFVQGLTAGAGMVIGRAIVRDLHTGAAAARLFSSLMLVTGLAPMLAPVVGGQLLRVTSWRGVFVVLALLGAAILATAGARLVETLPPERRRSGGVREAAGTLRLLAGERSFRAYALSSGLAFGSMFAYVGGSPFVLEGIFGLSPRQFSLVFAVNALGLVAGSQVNARLLGRFGPARLLRFALTAAASCSLVLLAVVSAGGTGVIGVLVPLFATVSSLSFVMPNATALALAEHREVAGSASAILGVTQFLIGGLVAPLVGLAGTGTAVPMAAAMAACGIAAVLVLRTAGVGQQSGRLADDR
jgi:DHA1 family bicyclomycin/chloramphenicol resistance-like MFS transporter